MGKALIYILTHRDQWYVTNSVLSQKLEETTVGVRTKLATILWKIAIRGKPVVLQIQNRMYQWLQKDCDGCYTKVHLQPFSLYIISRMVS